MASKPAGGVIEVGWGAIESPQHGHAHAVDAQRPQQIERVRDGRCRGVDEQLVVLEHRLDVRCEGCEATGRAQAGPDHNHHDERQPGGDDDAAASAPHEPAAQQLIGSPVATRRRLPDLLPRFPTGRSYVARMRTTAELASADRRHLWHPFTQQQGWCEDEPPLVIDHAEGTNLYDTDGNAYIDGVSSLWCNVHGHRHPAIDAAIRAQLDRVAHSTMLGLSHEPAIELAERLVAIAPPGLTPRVLLRQRLDRGRDRAEDGVPVVGAARRARADRLHLPARTPTTATRSARSRSAGSTCSTRSTGRCCSTPGRRAPATPTTCAQLLAEHAASGVAAVIVEPLVQGAAGMLMQPDGYLRAGARAVRRARRAADLRRGRDRLRAHRHDVRLRARGRLARPAVRRQGPDRRLPAARGDADHRARSTRASSAASRSSGPSSTATPTPATRSPARPAIATLETFERERTLERLQPKIELLTRLLEQRVAPPAGRGRGPPARLHGRDRADRAARPSALGHQVTLGRPPARRDHPPARRRRRADAAALDLRARAAPPGRDHRGGDRRGDRQPEASRAASSGGGSTSREAPRRRGVNPRRA